MKTQLFIIIFLILMGLGTIIDQFIKSEYKSKITELETRIDSLQTEYNDLQTKYFLYVLKTQKP